MRLQQKSFLLVSGLLFSSAALGQSSPSDQEAKSILADLVGFRSSVGHGQLPATAAYIVKRLEVAGVPQTDVVELTVGDARALIVRVPGSDTAARPILFSAHMDVVDARPEDWQRDPYKLIEENGYYFGRGSTDNKAGVTALISTILRFRSEGLVPVRTLLFAFVGDEETAMKTTEQIAAHPWVRGAEFAINTDAGNGVISEGGKPLVYQIEAAEKTFADFEIIATNPGGHSSKPRADNAIFDLADAIEKLRAYRFPVQSSGITRAYLAAAGKVTTGRLGKALRNFSSNPREGPAANLLNADPEYVGVTRTTCTPTLMTAGHADNALPQRAVVTVNCRIFPGTTKAEVQTVLTKVVANARMEIKLADSTPESATSEMREDVKIAVTRWVNEYYPGVPVVPYMEAGASDGLVYRAAGIPTFATSGIFRKNSVNFEHGLNERIPVASFYQSLDHIYRLAVELGSARKR